MIDIVPNHLGISAPAENPAWWDVLQRGPDSEYAAGSTSTGVAAGSSFRSWVTTRR